MDLPEPRTPEAQAKGWFGLAFFTAARFFAGAFFAGAFFTAAFFTARTFAGAAFFAAMSLTTQFWRWMESRNGAPR
ncbi:MAG: hypothetical protein RH982_10585 [Parvibaculum sp.]